MTDTQLSILSLLGRMHKTENQIVELLGEILTELRSKSEDSFTDLQQEEAPKKQPQKKTHPEDIGSELEDMFSNEIFQFLEVQEDKVQIIQFIGKNKEDTKKWRAINGLLREFGYKYYPVPDALGYWGF